MIMPIKIIESNFDTLEFERAFIENGDAFAIISGILCIIDAKQTILEHGLAFCQPRDPMHSRYWPVYTDVEIHGRFNRWKGVTDNPEIVRAVRKYYELVARGGITRDSGIIPL